MNLSVDIEKKFKDFQFKIKFTTDSKLTGILGASGSGKSMTLKCIAGIIKPDKGRIVLNDKVLFDSEKGINVKTKDRNIGYLFQNYALFPNMTVKQNILSGVQNKQKHEQKDILENMLRLFRIKNLEDRKPHQLSGGQQQRVALARLFAMNPDIIMLDEPFSALDSNLKEFIQLELLKLLEIYEKQVLMVSHNRDEVFRFCKDMVLVEKGKSVQFGKVDDIFTNPTQVSVAKLIGIKNIYPCKKVDENTILIDDWNVKLKISKEFKENTTHIGVRASDICMLKEDDGENCIEIDIITISKEFSFVSIVCKPVKYNEDNIVMSEQPSYILVKIPKNKFIDEYKNYRYVKFCTKDIIQLY